MKKPSTEEVRLFLDESNKIEGVFDDRSLKQAEKAWEYLIKQPKMTSDVVLKTHKILMKNQPLEPEFIGAYRKQPVWVGNREGEMWQLVPILTNDWCFFVNQSLVNHKEAAVDVLEEINKTFHVLYETIHPFIDGNGRTGRLFMNWWRLKIGLPLLVIYNSEKQQYYQWFRRGTP